MTGRAVGYDAYAGAAERAAAGAAWRAWWRGEGSRLAWSFDSDGATLAPPAPRPAGAPPLGPRLGGVVLPRGALDPKARWAAIAALRSWAEAPRPERLPALPLPADEAAFVADDAALDAAIGEAADRLAREVAAGSDRLPDVLRLARALRQFPTPALAAPLGRLALALPSASAWREAALALREHLDIIDPARVPVGR
jgi:hypothetical protein